MKLIMRLGALVLGISLGGCLAPLTQAELSDSGIKTRVETQLKAQNDLDLRYVTVSVNSGAVIVSGMVNSFQEKQLITKIVRRARGVDQAMINLIVAE